MSVITSLIKKVFRSAPAKEPPVDAGPILVGTHHKAGTNWLSSIFREIAQRHSLSLVEGDQPGDLCDVDIFFQNHSHFHFQSLPPAYRGLHLLRDPRDVIVSACFYHQQSTEEWLHLKRRRFGGMSYQEKLNSYASIEDKLLFEMEHTSLLTIKDMWCWDYQNPAFFEVKYEQLIADTELSLFRELFSFLGFVGPKFEEAISIAYDRSLFSGNVANNEHIRSGKVGQWPEYFNKVHKQRFLQLYGNVLIDLGYEPDHAWVDSEIPPGAVAVGEFIQRDIFDVLYHPDDPECHMATDPLDPEDDPQQAVAALQIQIKNRDREIEYLRSTLRRRKLV